MPASQEQILSAFEAGISDATRYLRTLTTEAAASPRRLTPRGQEVFTVPRAGLPRPLLLNHWYHHRGQLSVYFRLLDVPAPGKPRHLRTEDVRRACLHDEWPHVLWRPKDRLDAPARGRGDAAALRQPHARPMDFTGKPLKSMPAGSIPTNLCKLGLSPR